MSAWPESLASFPLEPLITRAREGHELSAIVTEFAATQGVSVRLPFVAQKQLLSEWCWAAVATSVGLFYGTGNWTQCDVATEQINTMIKPDNIHHCCEGLSESDCNIDGYLFFSLDQVRSVDRWSPFRPTPSQLYAKLARDKQLVCLRIAWLPTKTRAHFTTICGCTDPSQGGPFLIETSDTLVDYPGATLAYDDFPANYNGASGEWTDTFYTAGRFAQTTACGNGERAIVSINNGGDCASLILRGGQVFSSIGRIDYLSKSTAWGQQTAVGVGTLGSIGLDEAGNCVALYVKNDRLFYRLAALDPATRTLIWGAETDYGSGQRNSLAMMDHSVFLEVHEDQGILYSRVGWLRGDDKIDWDSRKPFDNGILVGIAADGGKSCVELHAGVGDDTGKLFATPGKIDFLRQKVEWGKTQAVAASSHGGVTLGAGGRCMLSFIGGGSACVRSGRINTETNAISWYPVQTLAHADDVDIAIDDLGRCVLMYSDRSSLNSLVGRY
jgi:hypothetical protein